MIGTTVAPIVHKRDYLADGFTCWNTSTPTEDFNAVPIAQEFGRAVTEITSMQSSEAACCGTVRRLCGFGNSLPQSEKLGVTKLDSSEAADDTECIIITTDEILRLCSRFMVSPACIRDAVLSAGGDHELALALLQSEMEARREGQNCPEGISGPEHACEHGSRTGKLLPRLRFGTRQVVRRLMRRLQLPSVWEAAVIHSLNEAKGNQRDASAALVSLRESSETNSEPQPCAACTCGLQRERGCAHVRGRDACKALGLQEKHALNSAIESSTRCMRDLSFSAMGCREESMSGLQEHFSLRTSNVAEASSVVSPCASDGVFGCFIQLPTIDPELNAGLNGVNAGFVAGESPSGTKHVTSEVTALPTPQSEVMLNNAEEVSPTRAPLLAEPLHSQEGSVLSTALLANHSLRDNTFINPQQQVGVNQSRLDKISCEQSTLGLGTVLPLRTSGDRVDYINGAARASSSGRARGTPSPGNVPETVLASKERNSKVTYPDVTMVNDTVPSVQLGIPQPQPPPLPPMCSPAIRKNGAAPPPPPPPPLMPKRILANHCHNRTRSIPIGTVQGIAGNSVFSTGKCVSLPSEVHQRLREEFKVSQPRSTSEAPKFVSQSILHLSRERNVGVVLHVLRLSVSTIEECVRNFNDVTLSEDNVASLVKVIPTTDDRRLIEAWMKRDVDAEVSTVSQLSTVSQFFVMCLSVDHYSDRIECWNTRNEFSCHVEDLEHKLQRAHESIQAVLGSKRLPRVLRYVLAISNFLNIGSRYEGARGFPISQLDHIVDFPTTNKKRTFLEHLVEVVEMCEPGLHCFTQELLPTVDYAVNFDVPGIAREVRYLRERLQKCVALCGALHRDVTWTSKLGAFLHGALPVAERIEQLVNNVEVACSGLAAFCCEDAKTFSMNKVMQCISCFSKKYDGKRASLQRESKM